MSESTFFLLGLEVVADDLETLSIIDDDEWAYGPCRAKHISVRRISALVMVCEWLEEYRKRAPGRPFRCLHCDTPFAGKLPYAFTVLVPHFKDGKSAVTAICAACCARPDFDVEYPYPECDRDLHMIPLRRPPIWMDKTWKGETDYIRKRIKSSPWGIHMV